jgi:hypothetical protein
MPCCKATQEATCRLCALDPRGRRCRGRGGGAACPAGTFNIVDDEPLTKGEYAEALAHAAGTAMWLRGPGRAALSFGDRLTSLTRSLRVSNARFRTATCWVPRYPSAREGWIATATVINHSRSLHDSTPTPPTSSCRRRRTIRYVDVPVQATRAARRARGVLKRLRGSAEVLAAGEVANVTEVVARPPRTLAEVAHDLMAAA